MTNRLLRFAAVAAAMVMVTVAVQRAASAQGIGGRSGSASRGQQALDDGRKALESDDFANAEQKFREAISLDPKLNDAYWRLAAILYGKKEYAKSVQLLRSAPDQQDLDIREQLGLALYKTANPPPAESIRLLEDVVSKRPDSYAAQLQLGQHLVRTEPKRAAAAIEVYLRYRPPSAASLDPQIHMVLGTAYVYARDWDAAQKEFEGLLRTKPNDMTAKLMLGSVLVGKGSCSQAISLYERILSEAQRQPSMYYNLGTCYLREKRAADALREAELYNRAKPTDAKGHVLTCDALFDLRNYPRALTECQQAEREDQVNGTIKGRIGRIYLGMRNFQSAVTYLEQAVAAGRRRPAPARIPRSSARWPTPTRRCTRPRTSSTRSATTWPRSAATPRRWRRRGRSTSSPATTSARCRRSTRPWPSSRATPERAPVCSACSTAAPASPSRRARWAAPTTSCRRR